MKDFQYNGDFDQARLGEEDAAPRRRTSLLRCDNGGEPLKNLQ